MSGLSLYLKHTLSAANSKDEADFKNADGCPNK